MLTTIGRWLRRRQQRPDLRFVMYTRAGCHLCDEAWTLLASRQKQLGFGLECIDVDTRPELAAQFGDCVPVVLVNGAVRFRGRINEVLLDRLFDAKSE